MKTLKTTRIGNLVVFKENGSGLWIVRNPATNQNLLAELYKRDAVATARNMQTA